MQRISESFKDPGETEFVTFDFNPVLGAASIATVVGVTASVWSGTDATPSAIISGSPSVVLGVVSQKITAGVAGVDYRLECTVTTTDARTLVLALVVPVRDA